MGILVLVISGIWCSEMAII